MRFFKKFFEPMQDDMSTTRYHAKQIERSRNPHTDVDSTCGPAIGGFSVDVNDEGPVKLNLRIGTKVL